MTIFLRFKSLCNRPLICACPPALTVDSLTAVKVVSPVLTSVCYIQIGVRQRVCCWGLEQMLGSRTLVDSSALLPWLLKWPLWCGFKDCNWFSTSYSAFIVNMYLLSRCFQHDFKIYLLANHINPRQLQYKYCYFILGNIKAILDLRVQKGLFFSVFAWFIWSLQFCYIV